MFGPNQFDTLIRAERMHQADLQREAEEWRMAKQAAVPATPVYRAAAWKLGAVMVTLGERLAAHPKVVNQNC
jgi:hypothetical protein